MKTVLIVTMILAGLAVAQICQQKPDIVPWFDYDPNMVTHPIATAVMVDSSMTFHHRFAQVCDKDGLSVYASIDAPFEITIGTESLLTGGTADNIITISGVNLPEGKYYPTVAIWNMLGKRQEFNAVFWSIDSTPPFLSPLPSGIESCDGCYDGS